MHIDNGNVCARVSPGRTFPSRRLWPCTCNPSKSSSRHPSSKYHPTWGSMLSGDAAGLSALRLRSHWTHRPTSTREAALAPSRHTHTPTGEHTLSLAPTAQLVETIHVTWHANTHGGRHKLSPLAPWVWPLNAEKEPHFQGKWQLSWSQIWDTSECPNCKNLNLRGCESTSRSSVDRRNSWLQILA